MKPGSLLLPVLPQIGLEAKFEVSDNLVYGFMIYNESDD